MDAAISRLFLQGVSTRGLRSIAKELFRCEVSATTVSRTTGYLDEELMQYQTKPITDDFLFLFLDGITQKVREIGVKEKVMLRVMGMKEDGSRKTLSFRMADSEDIDSWRAFLVYLKSRGLHGKYLKPCMAEAKGVFAAPSRREAIKRFKTWSEKWQVEAERAVRCMEKDLHHCLHYYAFPRELWKKIRTTNMLERDFHEVRRRTRPMGIFTNEESAGRIFYGVTNGIHNNGHHPLPVISAEKLT